jgi:hypothetical protein
MTPDARGWLWLEPLRLWIGVRDGEVYCFDEQGRQLGDYADLARYDHHRVTTSSCDRR